MRLIFWSLCRFRLFIVFIHSVVVSLLGIFSRFLFVFNGEYSLHKLGQVLRVPDIPDVGALLVRREILLVVRLEEGLHAVEVVGLLLLLYLNELVVELDVLVARVFEGVWMIFFILEDSEVRLRVSFLRALHSVGWLIEVVSNSLSLSSFMNFRCL